MRRDHGYIPELGRTGVQRACIELLEWHKVPYFRMNAGNQIIMENGKRRRMRGHPAGTADLLAAPNQNGILPLWLWIECKSTEGEQTNIQRDFQLRMERHGHFYLIVRDVVVLEDWLRKHGAL